MAYKFEKLEVWQMSLEYAELLYAISEQLPPRENFNLRNQTERAANSIALNIAEGSTGQTDKEQVRFLGFAVRSLIETVACLHLINRRGYLDDTTELRKAYRYSERLFRRLQAFRNTLSDGQMRETNEDYTYDLSTPFD